MRLLVSYPEKEKASKLSDYLTSENILNDLDDDDGSWSVWIQDEDMLELGKSILEDYEVNPLDPKFIKAKVKADEIKTKIEKENKKFNQKLKDGRTVFNRSRNFSSGPVVMFFIFVCVSIFFIQQTSEDGFLYDLAISSSQDLGLTEVTQKFQIWRLFTPAFMHNDIIHIFFNCYWLFILGSMIEDRMSSRFLLIFILGVAAFSNFAQYKLFGPQFYGFSGVNYAMFGFVWIMSRQDPLSGFFIPQSTVYLMLGFLALGVIGIFPRIANGAHVGGLMIGLAIGWARARFFSR